MQEKHHKYFWDGTASYTPAARVRRIIEYASFPDLIDYPFDEFKDGIRSLDINSLRTSENRKKFIKLAAPYFAVSRSWEDLIKRL